MCYTPVPPIFRTRKGAWKQLCQSFQNPLMLHVQMRRVRSRMLFSSRCIMNSPVPQLRTWRLRLHVPCRLHHWTCRLTTLHWMTSRTHGVVLWGVLKRNLHIWCSRLERNWVMMMIMAWMDYNDTCRGGALGVCYIPMNELYAIFRTSCRSTVVPDSHHEATVCRKALSGYDGRL